MPKERTIGHGSEGSTTGVGRSDGFRGNTTPLRNGSGERRRHGRFDGYETDDPRVWRIQRAVRSSQHFYRGFSLQRPVVLHSEAPSKTSRTMLSCCDPHVVHDYLWCMSIVRSLAMCALAAALVACSSGTGGGGTGGGTGSGGSGSGGKTGSGGSGSGGNALGGSGAGGSASGGNGGTGSGGSGSGGTPAGSGGTTAKGGTTGNGGGPGSGGAATGARAEPAVEPVPARRRLTPARRPRAA
jgi:hypothetical protein